MSARTFLPRSLSIVAVTVALAACGSASTPGAASQPPGAASQPQETAVASSPAETASQSASETTSPSDTPTSAPVAGGTATDFCGAFKEIQGVMDAPTLDFVSASAQFRAAAADMRKFAPAEIAAAANTYADVMDNIGKAFGSGTMDDATKLKALTDGMAGNVDDLAATAEWVAKNCDL